MKTRRSQQKGNVFKSHGAWFGRWYTGQLVTSKASGKVIREQKTERLFDATGDDWLDKKTAAGEMERILRPINQASAQRRVDTDFNKSVVEFAEQSFWPHAREHMKPSTICGYEKIWNKHLKTKMQGFRLREFSTVDATNLITDAARAGLGKHSVQHIRALGSMIFSHAVATVKSMQSNPFAEAKLLVKPKEPAQTYAAKPEEVLAMLCALTGQAKAQAAIGLCYFAGLRPGEMNGLHWEDWTGPTLNVVRNIWCGQVVAPKTGVGSVPCIQPLQRLLAALARAEGNPQSGPILRGVNGGYINLDYLNRKLIKPTLKKHGVKWEGFYSLRRGTATDVTHRTNSLIGAAGMLRHKNTQTTAQHYVKPVDEATQQAAREFENAWELLCSEHAAKGWNVQQLTLQIQ